jgi:parvulin-like peptidyl-prolyl isomerase
MTKKITSPINSKKFLTLFSLIISLNSCQNNSGSKSASNIDNKGSSDQSKTIIATYKGGQVTIKDFNLELEKIIEKNEKLKGVTFEKLNAEQKELIIKEFVIKEIASKEAKKRKLHKDDDYQEALKNFESEMLKQKLVYALIKDASDEKNVKKNYDEIVAKLKGKKDIRISYIAVKNSKDAEIIHQNLIKFPNNFFAQAKRKSIDKETAKNGGDLGFVVEDALPNDILKEIKTLQKNQISKPFFTNNKWLIIKLGDTRPAEILPYEKAKDALTQNLAKKAVEDFVSKGLDKAKISILIK